MSLQTKITDNHKIPLRTKNVGTTCHVRAVHNFATTARSRAVLLSSTSSLPWWRTWNVMVWRLWEVWTVVKSNGEAFYIHAMKAYGRGRAPLVLNLGSSWRTVVNFTPWPLYPMKERWYPLNRMLGGSQIRSGRFGDEKNLLPVPGFEQQTVHPRRDYVTPAPDLSLYIL
jgi:hypothetical protein